MQEVIIQEEQVRLRRVQALARWTDSWFSIPGTSFRFGLDAVVGFLPVFGDTLMLLVSLWVIMEAHRAGVPMRLKLKMLANVMLDWLIGSIPFVGDLFDIAWRANQRNADMFANYVSRNVA
ncbi:MAG: DUF4112 domain-containing protein [Kordiimonas sp.]